MSALRRFLLRLTTSATRRRDEQRLREELETHVALQMAEYVRAGVAPAEARRQALLKLGPVESLKELYRDEQGLPLLDHLLQDVRYALRQLRKAPLFTLSATLSLALGIGANAAVFTVIQRVLLAPLPVADPHELVFVVDERSVEDTSPRFSSPFYAQLRDNRVLSGTAAHFSLGLNATVDGRITRINGELVSGNYFTVVGAATPLGRPFTIDDDRTPGAHAVAIISDRFWRRRFGSDPSVLGRVVQINSSMFTIVGVAAPGFIGTDLGAPTDLWLPLMMQKEAGRDLLADARTNWLEIVGRLQSGASLERAGAELTAYLERGQPGAGTNFPRRRLTLLPGDKGNSGLRRELRPALTVLLMLTALALVLACVNVASLIAVRSAARTKEIAVRLALGARRSRLSRQLLTETLVLAAFGGTAGLLIAPWTASLLLAGQVNRFAIDTSLDVSVFAFGAMVSILTGLIIGQAPIFASRTIALSQAWGASSASIPGTRRVTVHDAIVTCQIAVSLGMLISAALLVQSLRTLSSIDPEFRADHVLLLSIDPKAAGYDGHRLEAFWRSALDRVSQVHGIQGVSLARIVPLAPGRQRQPLLDPVSGTFVEIDTNFIGPQYFRTLGVPIVTGREFDAQDGQASRPVAIVNERLARMFWPASDPIGKTIRLFKSSPLKLEVVGVVKDVKYRDLRDETGPMLYRSHFQTKSSDAMTLHVRTDTDPSALAHDIRLEMQRLDPSVALFGITTLEDQLNASFAHTRQAAALTGGFGLLALLLSGIGVYGVTALAVARQTHDIGIRLALGAQRRHIVRTIGRRGLTLVALGLVLGLIGSFGFTRSAEAMLYGVTAAASPTFAGMAALLAIVSLIAIYIPVRAATRLDAVTAIRYEP